MWIASVWLKYIPDPRPPSESGASTLVEANIRAVAPEVAFRAVRAARGKAVRAEPVAALYEQGRVHHVGRLPELEQQMCEWAPDLGQRSPDRMDALV
jgi:phage terminase large subunit-like protein